MTFLSTLFTIIACAVLACWLVALIAYLPQTAARLRVPLGAVMLIAGGVLITAYLVVAWIVLGHPPMRSIGQTLLWAAFFLPLISLVMEWRRGTRTLVIPTIFIGLIFVIGTLAIHDSPNKELMPALQSPWFAPHVLVYMLAYATLAVAALTALWHLTLEFFTFRAPQPGVVEDIRLLIYISYPLLTIGMLLGAFWGKIAWGHYWSWDPKETAAFVSWAAYLIYLHLEQRTALTPRRNLGLVLLVALLVLGCWFGINVLPSAKMSVHVYSGSN